MDCIDLEQLKQRLYAAKKLVHDAGAVIGDNTDMMRLAKAKAIMDIIEDLSIEAAAYIIEAEIERGDYGQCLTMNS